MDNKRKLKQNGICEGGKKRSNEPRADGRGPIFSDIFVHILATGIGKSRLNILKGGVLGHGGVVLDDFRDGRVTHVVAEDGLTFDRVHSLMGRPVEAPVPGAWLVKTSWLSDCLKRKTRVDCREYLFEAPKAKSGGGQNHQLSVSGCTGLKVEESVRMRGEASTTDVILESDVVKANAYPRTINKASFACSQSSGQQLLNHNRHITDKLEALALTFKTTKDHWRAMGYQRAVSALKNYEKEVTTWEEARALPGVGERLADKVWEIIESGRLRKMEEICGSEKSEALNLFMNIWGVGPNTAQLFVQLGFRTLEDVETKADLNRQQRIGLKHYWDILERMPREEAAEIEKTVKEAALGIQGGLEVMACGSYRRGNPTCGDVDILITHPDGKSHVDLLARLLTTLHQTGFLTDDLVAHDKSGNHHKYLGVCKLPGEASKHRRLDIIVVPYPEFACSVLYFTGSAHFNRSMRLLARKMGMTLSEHSLNAGVIRRGQERICNGTPLPTPTEESVFEQLGIPYQRPEERNH